MVNVKSVSLPFAEIFCTTISTFIEFFDKGLKIEAATPGLSFTPTSVIFASFYKISYSSYNLFINYI